jgi:hypothetical protein
MKSHKSEKKCLRIVLTCKRNKSDKRERETRKGRTFTATVRASVCARKEAHNLVSMMFFLDQISDKFLMSNLSKKFLQSSL